MRENGTKLMIGLTSFLYRITMLAKDQYDLRGLGHEGDHLFGRAAAGGDAPGDAERPGDARCSATSG